MSASGDSFDTALRQMLAVTGTAREATSVCPNEQTMVLFLEDRLGAAERETVERHVASCGQCVDLLIAHAGLPPERAPKRLSAPKETVERAKKLVVPSSSRFPFLSPFVHGLFGTRWALAWAIPLLFLILVPVSWHVAEPIIREKAVTQVRRTLQMPGFEIGSIGVGWRSVSVSGVEAVRAETRLFSVGDASVEFSLSDLAKGQLVVDRVKVQSPYLLVKTSESGKMVLGGFAEKDLDFLRGSGMQVRSAAILAENASIDLVDSGTRPKPVRIGLRRVTAAVRNVSIAEDASPSVPSSFEATGTILQAATDGKLSANGAIDNASGGYSMDLRAGDVDIVPLLPYYADRVTGNLTGGMVDLRVSLEVTRESVKASGVITLRDLVMKPNDGSFFGVAFNAISNAMAAAGDNLDIPFTFSVSAEALRPEIIETMLSSIEQALPQALAARNGKTTSEPETTKSAE